MELMDISDKIHSEPIYPNHMLTTLSGHAFYSFIRASIDCKSKYYIIAFQPSLHAEYLKYSTMPLMKESLDKASETLVVPYGYGGIELENIIKYISDKCHSDHIFIDAESGSYPLLDGEDQKILNIRFPPLKGSLKERQNILKHHDKFLHYIITSLPHGSKYTMIYLSTPEQIISQHQDIPTNILPVIPIKYDLKQPKGLFSKYAFLSEGIHMMYSWMVLIVLFPILIIALSAISSIKISYGAFELKKNVFKKNK
ncbi:hypothetical protein PCANB_002918 [Pneumocystis canis]|nr:hypothetical protein PCANB_002918 [Pneumocystis canis]